MADPLRNLEAEALNLAEKDRAELARVLLLSLDDDSKDQETERSWAEEAERRFQEIKAGSVQAIPSEAVMEEARSRLR